MRAGMFHHFEIIVRRNKKCRNRTLFPGRLCGIKCVTFQPTHWYQTCGADANGIAGPSQVWGGNENHTAGRCALATT